MSQQGRLEDGDGNLGVETLTGNTGGPISPDGAGNIDILGSGPYTFTGNPGTFSLTLSDDGTIAITYTADTGSATPAANNLNILGDATQGSITSGAGSTITITNDDATTTQKGVIETSTDAESIAGSALDVAVTPSSLAAKLGTQTSDGIPYGTGTTNALGWTTGLTDGQLVIGSTSGVPAAASLTSTGSTITITPGANSINLETDGSIATQYDTDSGSAVPSAGVLDVLGGTLMNTAGATNVVTINADDNVVGSVATDSGTATPSSNSFTIAGSGSVSTSGSGSTVTITGSPLNQFTVTSLDNTDSPYTVLATDQYLSCDVSSGALTIELPNAPSTGTFYMVKDAAGNSSTFNITVTTVGGVVTIDGTTSFVMNTDYEAGNFMFNGTSYEVF